MTQRERLLVRDQSFDSSGLRTAIVALVALKIAGIIAIVDPLGWEAFDLPKSLFSRATAWLIAGFLVLAVWRYGLAIIPRTWLHLGVVFLAAAVGAATVFAENPFIAAFGEQYRYLGLTFFADMLVLYVAVAVAFRTTRDWVVLGAAIACGALIALGYAGVQVAGADPMRWAAVGRTRPFSVFGNPDMFGHFLSLGLGLGLGLAVFASGTHVWLVRLIGLCCTAIGLATAAVVATRGTLLGVGAILLAAAGLSIAVRGIRGTMALRLFAGAIVAAVALGLLVVYSPLGERAQQTITSSDIAVRLMFYDSAVRAAADRPILGWGSDSFAVAYPYYRNVDPALLRGNEPESSAHSWPLQAVATTGFLGLLALVILLAFGTILLFRACLGRARPLAAPALLGWFGYWTHAAITVGSISVDWYPWVALGLAAALSGAREPIVGIRRIPMHIAAVAVLGGLVLAAAEIPAWSANRSAYAASQAIFRQDVDIAINSSRSAVSQDPRRALYWDLLGAAYEMRQSWREANDSYGRAAQLSPHLTHYVLDLARAQARQARAGDLTGGGGASAIRTAQRAVSGDQDNWEAWSVLSQTQVAFGQPDAALESLVAAIHLYKGNRDNDEVALEASTKLLDLGRGRALLEVILTMRESATLRIALAQVALRQDDREAAMVNARRALALDPGNVRAKDLVATVGR